MIFLTNFFKCSETGGRRLSAPVFGVTFLFTHRGLGDNFFYLSHCLNFISHLLFPLNPVRLGGLYPYRRGLGSTNGLFLFHQVREVLHHHSLPVCTFGA